MVEEEIREDVHVLVSFPISRRGSFEASEPRNTTVEVILTAAMDHFGVENDTQFSYLLSCDGIEQRGSILIGSLAGDRGSVRFTLIKKITQG